MGGGWDGLGSHVFMGGVCGSPYQMPWHWVLKQRSFRRASQHSSTASAGNRPTRKPFASNAVRRNSSGPCGMHAPPH